MSSKKKISGIGLAGAMAFGVLAAPAFALTINPIDPSLPLDQQAWALCGISGVPNVGGTGTTCETLDSVVNPATLNHVVGTSAGTADLHSGTLRSRSTAQALSFGSDLIRSGGYSSVKLYDTITMEGGFTGTVELRMLVDGSFFTTDAVNPNVMGSEMSAKLLGLSGTGGLVANTLVDVTQYNDGEVGIQNQGVVGSGVITTNASGTLNLFDPANVQVGISVFFSVTPSSPTFSFRADLATSSGLGFTDPVNQVKQAWTDFGNTAQLSLIVPEGVTWQSASGAFLVPAPVPVPAAVWLFGSGLLGLIGIARSKSPVRTSH